MAGTGPVGNVGGHVTKEELKEKLYLFCQSIRPEKIRQVILMSEYHAASSREAGVSHSEKEEALMKSSFIAGAIWEMGGKTFMDEYLKTSTEEDMRKSVDRNLQ